MNSDKQAVGANNIDWPYTHQFSRSVEALGETETSITLREPTTADLLNHGVLDGMLNGESMVGLIATLSGWAPPKVKAIPGIETIRLSGKLSRFFGSVAS